MNDSQKLLADYAFSGSEQAFTELVNLYLNFVYSTALRLTEGDAHLAEDVTQTVFTDLARVARTLSKGVMVGGWLHRHTCFIAANAMRAERRRHSYERQAAEMNATHDDSSANLARVTPELDEAINELSDGDRRAILLRFFEQRDFASVGQGLGTSEEAARKRVSRALEKLHSRLSRRGVTLSAAGLAVALGAVIAPAPSGIAAEIAATALAGVATGAAGLTGLNLMTAVKMKSILLIVAFVAAVAAPLALKHQSELALREENQALKNEIQQMTAFQAASVIASNQPPQIRRPVAMPDSPNVSEEHRELLRLRGQIGVLRDQLARAKQPLTDSAAQSASGEKVDISLSFPNIPMLQLFDFYQQLSGKKVEVSPEVQTIHSVWLKSPGNRPLTKTEALQWIEEALKDQCQVVFTPKDDGSLFAQPALRNP